jgi:hypothetical protein
MPEKIRFSIAIPYDEFISYYQGIAKNIQVTAMDGRTVRFPANVVHKFLTREGINGVFDLYVDGDYKMIDLKKIG